MDEADTVDRRRSRTDVPEEAILRYLRAVAQRAGIRAIALVDETGRTIGDALGVDLHAFAEIGVACARGVGDGSELALRDDLYAHSWSEDDGATFYLASLGARVPRLRDVIAAVQRIQAGMHR